MLKNEVIDNEINRFKSDISKRSTLDSVRRNIIFGRSILLDEDKMFDLSTEISHHFQIHPAEIVTVGSGKLGFSIAPKKMYLPFGERSDLDVAIVSPKLFEELWEELFLYANSPDLSWKVDHCDRFKGYLLRGWIRPDLLPFSEVFLRRKDWFEFFRQLTVSRRYGPFKISAGLYRNWFFFEQYQSICVKNCKDALETNKYLIG